MDAPGFWYSDKGPWPPLLSPLGGLYGLAGRLRRFCATPWTAPVPVVCVGNLTAGGTGKTPITLALARRLKAQGHSVHLLTRGYGGRLPGPVQVDPERHSPADVGDEPLLLASTAPTWVARDRAAGARAAVKAGADIIIMDDGFQNPSLAKDFALIVIDGAQGFGNGHVIPAGPLRESIAAGLLRAQAAVIVGEDKAGVRDILRATAPSLPVLACRLAPATATVSNDRVLAFAGIGRPEKFAETLGELGCEVADFRAFPDHHRYTKNEAVGLLAEAERLGAVPVTTAKDAVRLPDDVRAKVKIVEIEAVFGDETALDALLGKATRPVLTP